MNQHNIEWIGACLDELALQRHILPERANELKSQLHDLIAENKRLREALKKLHDGCLETGWAETEKPGEEREREAFARYMKALANAAKTLKSEA